MNAFYEWLYDYCVEPQMDETLLQPVYQEQKQAWCKVVDQLSPDEALTAADFIECLKVNWGALAFDYGIKIGFMLSVGLTAGPEK